MNAGEIVKYKVCGTVKKNRNVICILPFGTYFRRKIILEMLIFIFTFDYI
jgi:hypothetical protein